MGVTDTKLVVEITAKADKARAELHKFESQIKQLSGGSIVGLQRGLKGATSELSNLAGIFTGNRLSGVTSQFTSLGGAISGIPGPAGLAVGSIAAIATVAIGAAVGLFALAKSASDFGSEMFDAKIRTGLSAEGITALGFAAKISGSSLETASGAVSKFNVLVGQAAQGEEKAIAILAKYKITTFETNEAFNQAVKSIGEMTKQEQKAVAIRELMKDKTGQMLPIIDQLNGRYKEYIEIAKKLGVTLTEEDLAAADKFGDTLDLLGTQAQIIGAKFATEMMPLITGAMQDISQALSQNQSVVREWGRTTADILQFLADILTSWKYVLDTFASAFNSFFRSNVDGWNIWSTGVRTAIALATLGLSELLAYAFRVDQALNKDKKAGMVKEGVGSAGFVPGIVPSGGGKGKGGGGGKAAGKSKAAEEAKKELAAQIQLQELALKRLEKAYDETMQRITDAFKENRDQGLFGKASLDAQKEFTDGVIKIREELLRLQDKQGKDETGAVFQVRLRKQWDEIKSLSDRVLKHQEETNKSIVDDDKKRADEQKKLLEEVAKFAETTADDIHKNLVKNADDELKAALEHYDDLIKNGNFSKQQRLDAENELYHVLARNYSALTIEENARFYNQKLDLEEWKRKKTEEVTATIKDEELRKATLESINAEYQRRLDLIIAIHNEETKGIEEKTAVLVTPAQPVGGFFGGLFNGLGTSVEDALKPVDQMNQLGQVLASTFQQVAQAVGQAVSSFVLLGSAGGGFRKMAAEVIASIAQMAVVQALFELAQGLAMLALTWFTGNPKYAKSAGDHFASAAMFGMIGGVAAIAGRAVAGNAFQQQTASGGAGASAGSQGSRSGSGTSGGAYSSQEEQKISTGRNAPGAGGITITMRDRTGAGVFGQLFKMDWEANGMTRKLLTAKFGT